MSGVETISFRNQQNPRNSDYYAELAKNVTEIVLEKATDGNSICIEIYQKAKGLLTK